MEFRVREQVKVLLAQENKTLKDLSKLLSEKTGKTYSPDGLSQKLRRGSFSYNEVLIVAKLLGYKIQFIKEEI